MNADVKQKWVAALRSGEFEQCKGTLRMGDRFCCLGVLSELAVRDGVIQPATALNNTDWRASRGDGESVYVYDNEAGHLPNAVALWAGLIWEFESYDDEGTMETEANVDPDVNGLTLSFYNDERGKTFSEIADLIEEYL